jgi:hypothetical protein
VGSGYDVRGVEKAFRHGFIVPFTTLVKGLLLRLLDCDTVGL